MRSFITGIFIVVLLVSQTTLAKPTSHKLGTLEGEKAEKMSSSNSDTSGLRLPRGAVRIGNSPLLTAAMSVNAAVSSGQITPAQARLEAQRLIQANKQAVNLQLLNQSLGK